MSMKSEHPPRRHRTSAFVTRQSFATSRDGTRVPFFVTARGGAEYGEAWHRAGMRERKQNVFDDFVACAEQLMAGGYTSPQHLAMLGGSSGGLLVGVVMEQRPELFAAALPVVGVLDMLRYDRFTGPRSSSRRRCSGRRAVHRKTVRC